MKELLIIVLLAGAGYLFYHSQDLQSRLNEAIDENTRLTDQVQTLTTQMKTQPGHQGPGSGQFFNDPFNSGNSGGNPLDAAPVGGRGR